MDPGSSETRVRSAPFHPIDAGGFALFLDMGGQPLPGTLVLELRGRRGKIAAFWNDQAWVG